MSRPSAGRLVLVGLLTLAAACAGGREEPPTDRPAPPGEEEPRAAPEEPRAAPEPEAPERYYWAYVASDGPDMVSRLRYGPGGAVSEKAISVGTMPGRPDGVGQIAVSPDGGHWFLSLTGGLAGGSVWKYQTGSDRMAGRLELGTPARDLGLTPDGSRLVITSGGDGGGPATVSLIRTSELRETDRLATCREGRASVPGPGGDRAYSVCLADDVLVEISLSEDRVSRTTRLPGDERCGPAALAVSRDGDRLHVACGDSRRLLVLETGSLSEERELPLEGRPVAVAVGPDGRMLVLVEDPPALLVTDADGSGIRDRIPVEAPRPTALAVTDDGRYAFVAARGFPGEARSTVLVIDLRARVSVATLRVPEGATSVAFWRSLASR